MKASILNRKLHRYGAILTAIPLLLVIVTGIILQLKKDWSWVQPETRRGTEGPPVVSFEDVLAAARAVPEAAIAGWDDVDRLDVRPGKGMLKVRAENGYEVQLDATTAEVLQVAYRRSDLIESLHDGSFFADWTKLWIFLPVALVLLGLWVTGLYLWFLPVLARRRKRRRT